jgi:hypothetical protein
VAETTGNCKFNKILHIVYIIIYKMFKPLTLLNVQIMRIIVNILLLLSPKQKASLVKGGFFVC